MNKYKQLTREQRLKIHAYKKTGMSQVKIALLVEVSQSSISRELKRNTGQRGYRANQADPKLNNARKIRLEPM